MPNMTQPSLLISCLQISDIVITKLTNFIETLLAETNTRVIGQGLSFLNFNFTVLAMEGYTVLWGFTNCTRNHQCHVCPVTQTSVCVKTVFYKTQNKAKPKFLINCFLIAKMLMELPSNPAKKKAMCVITHIVFLFRIKALLMLKPWCSLT